MKIGLLFGSFNPIHIGHIAIATSVLNSHVVDKVFFVVAMQNPWKTQKAIDFNIRCSMVHNAIKDVENLQQLKCTYHNQLTLTRSSRNSRMITQMTNFSSLEAKMSLTTLSHGRIFKMASFHM